MTDLAEIKQLADQTNSLLPELRNREAVTMH